MRRLIVTLALALLYAPGARAEALQLLRVTPAGEDVPAQSQIVLAFDRAVVPLGRMERDSSEVPVTITPAVACHWRWLDTQNLACNLADGDSLREATAYTIAVQPGFVAQDGSSLASPRRYRFVTSLPRVQYAEVGDWSGPSLPQLRVQFSQPVTAKSVEQSITLDGAPLQAQPAWYDRETPFWTPDGEARATWLLRPRAPLADDRGYSLQVQPGLRSAFGAQRGDESRSIAGFQTFAAPRLIGLRCDDNGRTRVIAPGARCAPLEGASLVFNVPVAAQALRDALTIVPDLRKAEANDDDSADDGTGDGDDGDDDSAAAARTVSGDHARTDTYDLRLPFALAAETDYQLTVAAALQDRFGRAFGKATTLGFRTGARTPRLVFEHSPAVIESGVDSDVPAIVTNLETLHLGAQRITAGADADRAASRDLKLPAVRNLAYATPLGMRELLGAGSGVLLGELSSTPATSKKPLPFFAEVTPWQVHAKYGNANLLVWVTAMADGAAVGSADVAVLDGWHGAVKASGRTDASGLVQLPGSAELDPQLDRQYLATRSDGRQPLVLRVTRGNDIALLPLTSEFQVDTWRASREQISEWRRERHGHLRAWGTTAQGVYRAGDTIQYKLYVRDDGDRTLKPAPAGDYTLRIIDPTGTAVQVREHLALSAFGAIDGELKLADAAAVGWYRFELQPAYARDLTLEPIRVLVSDFVPAPFHVSAEWRAGDAMPGARLDANLRATLHGGGPFADARARITARVQAAPFEPQDPLAKRYSFDTWQSGGRESAPLLDQEATLDNKGEWTTSLQLNDSAVLVGDLVLEGTVQDDRGRAIVGQARIPYFGRDRYIGINYSGWAQAGQAAEVDTLVVDRDGKPQADAPYYVTIERRITKGARVKGAGNAYITRYVQSWQRVASCKGRSHADGDHCRFTPDAAGELRATAMTQDRHGRLHESTTWIYAQGRDAVLWEDRPDFSLDVRVDKAKYKVGDVARLFVENPYPGATALITVERYGVLERRTQKLETATPVIEIPIKPEYLPGAYVSVTVVSPRVAAPVKDGVDLGKPTFRMGYATLKVEDPYRELQVEVTPSKAEARPREALQVELAARPRHDSGEPIEFAVAVLDDAVFDLISGGSTYFDPLQGFNQLDALDLANYSLLTRLIGRQKFEKKGANAGGDGGADLSLRSVDKFVAYWNPSLKADADGRARFTFTTPDNLSGWRVLAMAVTPGDRMGLGQGRIAVNKPTELRSALPNQLALGDQVDAAFTLMNRARKPRTLGVSIEASGAARGRIEQSLTLKPFERRNIGLPLTVDQAGTVHFVVRAGDAADRDALQLDVPVHERPLTMTAADFSPLTAAQPLTLPLQLPAGATHADLRLAFASSLLGNLDGAFSYMADYPYLCWEQRLTKGVMAAHFLKLRARLASPPDWSDAQTLTQKTLDDAASFQAPGGGMTFFVPQDAYQSPYLSAYTALAFGWLQAMGYRPPNAVWDKLDAYLRTLLREDIQGSGYDSAELRAQVRAVALAALAQRGQLGAEDLQRYQVQLPRMGLFGEALFAQAAAHTPGGGDALQAATARMLARGQQSAGSFVLADDRGSDDAWLLGSPLRSNCAALSALLAPADSHGTAGDAELAMKLTRTITQARGTHTHWENTQENLFCTRALIDYADRYEAVPLKMTASAALDAQTLGSVQLADGRSATIDKPLEASAGAARSLQIRGSGDGRAYVTTTLRYATPVPDAALDAGLSVSRHYFVQRDGQWQALSGPLMSVRQGERLKIELSLDVPAWMTYVVVDDPVPAGLEPVNPDLATASGLDAETLAQASPAYPYPFYYRALRFDGVRFYADEIAAGHYKLAWIAQAVASGEFAVTETHAERMYDPDVFGNGIAARLKVEPAP
ncbi:Ig-like domain-containing alpha-2-macroglobulin family protein [Solimonas terrae]|uniref:Large extracellular alpha-helical protein n=1 Tax=Solimonas terrae TaxID=1396819 RepID=A0A6M2BLV8_9GAMM|nr:Ig-like domain-containing alpha-2-macroglobulin family protein [Solimonas terrae]NGY03682.1 large extracellular alpha-helical protein [Solimonas terrae]